MSTEVSKKVHDSILKSFTRYKNEYSGYAVSRAVFTNIQKLANDTIGNFVILEEYSLQTLDDIDEDIDELMREFTLTFESKNVKDSFDFIYYEKIPGR